MKLGLYLEDLSSPFWDTENKNKQQFLEQIRVDHQIVLHKLLPEIDLHFHNLLAQELQDAESELRHIHADYLDFATLLKDHIETEELLILPLLEQREELHSEAAKAFHQKHPDFEKSISILLSNLKSRLSSLEGRLAFSVLLLKFERLQILLAQHQVVEDLVFDPILSI